MEDVSNYEKLREDAQKFYSSIGKVFAPALNQEVLFSAEGFNHIVYKSSRSEREKASQILKRLPTKNLKKRLKSSKSKALRKKLEKPNQ